MTCISSFIKESLSLLFYHYSAGVQENLLNDARKMITNEQIDLYNDAAEDIL